MPRTARPCPFCGAPLEPRVATLFGKDVFLGFRDCGCPGAAAQRAREDAEAAQRERREAARRSMRLYEAAGIPPLYLQRREGCEGLYGLVRASAARILDAHRSGRGTYVVGGVGTGKSLLAATACRYAVDAGIQARFTTASKVLDAIRSCYGTKRSADAVIGSYASVPFLVLDDLGKESPTDWTLQRLFELVNGRYENMRPLVATTQYERDELVGRLAKNGDRETAVAIVSRLSETCDRLDWSGPDRRLPHG